MKEKQDAIFCIAYPADATSIAPVVQMIMRFFGQLMASVSKVLRCIQ